MKLSKEGNFEIQVINHDSVLNSLQKVWFFQEYSSLGVQKQYYLGTPCIPYHSMQYLQWSERGMEFEIVYLVLFVKRSYQNKMLFSKLTLLITKILKSIDNFPTPYPLGLPMKQAVAMMGRKEMSQLCQLKKLRRLHTPFVNRCMFASQQKNSIYQCFLQFLS